MHDSVPTAVRQIGGNRVAGRWAFSPAAFGLLIIVRDYAFSGSLKSDHEDRVILLANAYHRSATLSFALFIFTAHSVPRGFPKFLCPARSIVWELSAFRAKNIMGISFVPCCVTLYEFRPL